ncbi:ComF family protein [Robertkochia marina]|uniref:ComF family protein n=1 Tax=Robertkochia marina TaxID=1227945 RepID=A0A4S3M3R4_9FLAO|nr:ComF family protein [Robertkochia marina]THD69520.1 ComF family protein [Robertkochia marina]TRZ47221.1 ComF family protein [Robertkochia marina]
MTGAVKIINDLQNLLFPASCLCCKALIPDSSQFICVQCSHQLPLTAFTDREANPCEKIFFGRVPIEQATSLLWYHKNGPVQHLIHELKYHGRQKAGTFLGNWLGEEMKTSPRFNNIDLVIPMPLQKRRHRKRGYNQTDNFARALAQHLEAPFRNDLLIRCDTTSTLTHRGRKTRIFDASQSFEVISEDLRSYRHVLLTDDVVTTGTTLESAARVIKKYSDIKVSIATMAITY